MRVWVTRGNKSHPNWSSFLLQSQRQDQVWPPDQVTSSSTTAQYAALWEFVTRLTSHTTSEPCGTCQSLYQCWYEVDCVFLSKCLLPPAKCHVSWCFHYHTFLCRNPQVVASVCRSFSPVWLLPEGMWMEYIIYNYILYYIISYHIISYHIISYHIISHHIILILS